MREEQAVLVGQHSRHLRIEPGVRLANAAAKREVADDGPDDDQDEEDEQADADPALPAPPPPRLAGLRLARLAPISVGTRLRPLERDATLHAPAPVDAVGLLSRRHRGSRVAALFGLPVGIENDANAATYAEFHFGAGRAARTMVMLTLGTGCGGGAVVDGQLFRGWAEFGHIVIVFDGVPCQGTCTGRGHLEPYVTGLAATNLAQEAFGPAADAHRLVRLAEEGDELARDILAGMGRHLGAGIGSLVNIFNPELVVIGGGFAAAGDFVLDPAREIVRREALAHAGDRVRIVRAELGTAAGLIGAGLVAFDALG